MPEGALSDLKVVEYADFISGPFCGKLMADLGAQVLKVEPPMGDSARRSPPFLGDTPHPEKSGLFLYLNTSKKGVSLNLHCAAGAAVFKDLVRGADVLIENFPPTHMESLGLGYETLAGLNPGLVVTSITAFGQRGPYRDYKATNLTGMHMGGVGYYTPGSVDEPEKEPPLKGGGHQAHFVAGLMGAMLTLSGVFTRAATGKGQHIDLSEHEAVAFNMMRDIAGYSYDKANPGRLKSEVRAFGTFLPCKDGFVQLYTTDDRQWRGFVEAMGNPHWAKDARFADPASRTANWESLQPLILQWTKDRSKEEIYQAVQPRHAACAPVNTVEEALRSAQLASREYFVQIEHLDAGRLRYPGAPCKLSRTPFQASRPAPRHGEHNEEVFCGQMGYTRGDLVRMRAMGVI